MEDRPQLSPNDLTRYFDLLWKTCERLECTPERAIDLLQGIAEPPVPRNMGFRLLDLVERVRRVRMKRNELAGSTLFRDPAWDMLLELYCAHGEKRRISINGLCHSSGVPPTTALRYVQRLEKEGMVERVSDSDDYRRCWVRPLPKALDTIEGAASMLIEQLHAIGAMHGPDDVAVEQREFA